MTFENTKKLVTFTNSTKPTGRFARFQPSIFCKQYRKTLKDFLDIPSDFLSKVVQGKWYLFTKGKWYLFTKVRKSTSKIVSKKSHLKLILELI